MEMMESIIVEGDVQQMEVKYIHVEEGTMRLSFLKLKGIYEDCPEFIPDYIVVMCGIYDLVSVIKDTEGKRFKLLYPEKK